MTISNDRGKRLLVPCLDHIAKTDPAKPWGFRPTDEGDLSLGFEAISFDSIANAVNHAAWWLYNDFPENGLPFEPFAYQARTIYEF